jgi:hypothetical protein
LLAVPLVQVIDFFVDFVTTAGAVDGVGLATGLDVGLADGDGAGASWVNRARTIGDENPKPAADITSQPFRSVIVVEAIFVLPSLERTSKVAFIGALVNP